MDAKKLKEHFNKVIDSKKAELEKMSKRSAESEDVKEVRSLMESMAVVRNEIHDAEEQLKTLDDDKAADKKDEESRGQFQTKGGLNPMVAYGQNPTPEKREENLPKRATMEYRKAFMDYAQRGIKSDILEYRGTETDTQTEASALGVLLPITIVQEIITEIQGIYGQLYAKVNKTNVKGGIKYPIGSFSAVFHRMGENGAPTPRQAGGSVTGSIEFSYKLGEIRLAKTLLESVLEVSAFEQKFANLIVETYVKAMDIEILQGGNATLFPDEYQNQMEGIITEANKPTGSRILADHIIEFTEADMKDWKKWQKNFFAKIPLAMRKLRPEFVMTANTYESNIKTLHDDNNRPLYYETFNPQDGDEKATFKGREVLFIEEGNGIENFDDASAGDYFGIYWVPQKAYSINTNLEFFVKRYFDDEKNQYVDKALVINDGKILDNQYIWLLKKKG